MERRNNMNDQRTLLVGFDLGDDFSQISCFSNKINEPESVCFNSDKMKFSIPTIIGVKNDSKDWVFGEEAVNIDQSKTGIAINSLLTRIDLNQNIDIFGIAFPPIKLLEKYLRKCLQLLKMYYPSNSILKLVITLQTFNETRKNAVYAALENLGIGKDRAFVQSHSESYQYYALSQVEELWMNDVGLFELDERGLIYHQITINRKTKPYLVGMIEKDFANTLRYDMLEASDSKEKLEYIFSNIANNVLYKQMVSTIYVTGKGFDGSWADNVLKDLCRGRRIFKGQNLYTKGACYAAKKLSEDQKNDSFLLLNEDMVMCNFKIHGYYDAKQAEVLMVKAATPWYEIDESLDLILDEEQKIPIMIQDIIKNETKQYEILLNGLPNRPNKLTRVRVRIKLLDKDTAVVTVKDLGFGEFYPSTNRIWENEIKFNE